MALKGILIFFGLGGLKVRDICLASYTFLGKWYYRMLTDVVSLLRDILYVNIRWNLRGGKLGLPYFSGLSSNSVNINH